MPNCEHEFRKYINLANDSYWMCFKCKLLRGDPDQSIVSDWAEEFNKKYSGKWILPDTTMLSDISKILLSEKSKLVEEIIKECPVIEDMKTEDGKLWVAFENPPEQFRVLPESVIKKYL
jgi:hypothetical protein